MLLLSQQQQQLLLPHEKLLAMLLMRASPAAGSPHVSAFCMGCREQLQQPEQQPKQVAARLAGPAVLKLVVGGCLAAGEGHRPGGC